MGSVKRHPAPIETRTHTRGAARCCNLMSVPELKSHLQMVVFDCITAGGGLGIPGAEANTWNILQVLINARLLARDVPCETCRCHVLPQPYHYLPVLYAGNHTTTRTCCMQATIPLLARAVCRQPYHYSHVLYAGNHTTTCPSCMQATIPLLARAVCRQPYHYSHVLYAGNHTTTSTCSMQATIPLLARAVCRQPYHYSHVLYAGNHTTTRTCCMQATIPLLARAVCRQPYHY